MHSIYAVTLIAAHFKALPRTSRDRRAIEELLEEISQDSLRAVDKWLAIVERRPQLGNLRKSGRSDIAPEARRPLTAGRGAETQASYGAVYERRGVSLIIRSSTFLVIRWMRESTPNGPANVRAGM